MSPTRLPLVFKFSKKARDLITAKDREISDLTDKIHNLMDNFRQVELVQIELGGRIIQSIQSSAEISSSGEGSYKAVKTFQNDFAAMAQNLMNVNIKLEYLSQEITKAGTATATSSAAVEEMDASIKQISQESQRMASDMGLLVSLSQKGQVEMENTLTGFQEVTRGIDDLEGFIEIINSIATQTSLLSMNAAIEAAQAGEAGKGFAVVADEVGKLADSAGQNAQTIAKRLKDLIAKITSAQEHSKTTAEVLEETEIRIGQAADSFRQIQMGTREMEQASQEILESILALSSIGGELQVTSGSIVRENQDIDQKLSGLLDRGQEIEDSLKRILEGNVGVGKSVLGLAEGGIFQLKSALSDNSQDPLVLVPLLALQHGAWVSRIRSVMDGVLQLSEQEISDHHNCDLGRWIDSQGSRIGDRSEWAEFLRAHEEVHRTAKSLVRQVRAGQEEDKAETFAALRRASSQVIEFLPKIMAPLVNSADPGDLITWRPAFFLGNTTIDSQHKVLVDLINKLYRALRKNQGPKSLAGVVKELTDYTKFHFSAEEELFTPTDYPGTEGHLAQHRGFEQKISQVLRSLETGTGVPGSETLGFLKKWLLDHILKVDMGYRPYLKKENLR